MSLSLNEHLFIRPALDAFFQNEEAAFRNSFGLEVLISVLGPATATGANDYDILFRCLKCGGMQQCNGIFEKCRIVAAEAGLFAHSVMI